MNNELDVFIHSSLDVVDAVQNHNNEWFSYIKFYAEDDDMVMGAEQRASHTTVATSSGLDIPDTNELHQTGIMGFAYRIEHGSFQGWIPFHVSGESLATVSSRRIYVNGVEHVSGEALHRNVTTLEIVQTYSAGDFLTGEIRHTMSGEGMRYVHILNTSEPVNVSRAYECMLPATFDNMDTINLPELFYTSGDSVENIIHTDITERAYASSTQHRFALSYVDNNNNYTRAFIHDNDKFLKYYKVLYENQSINVTNQRHEAVYNFSKLNEGKMMADIFTSRSVNFDGSNAIRTAQGSIITTFSGQVGSSNTPPVLNLYSRCGNANFILTGQQTSFGRKVFQLAEGDEYYFIVTSFDSDSSVDLSVADLPVSSNPGGVTITEGTFTLGVSSPLAGDYVGVTGITNIHGTYQKAGRLVSCKASFTLSGVSGSVSQKSTLSLNGLPFVPSDLSSPVDQAGVNGFIYNSLGSTVVTLLSGAVTANGNVHVFTFFTGTKEGLLNAEHLLEINYLTDE